MFGPEDWLTLNPTVFNESGLRPPDECICIPEIDDHCEMVMQHIPADAIAGITRNQTTQYNAWNRVRIGFEVSMLYTYYTKIAHIIKGSCRIALLCI